jgi:hypothetical protein
VQVDESRVLVCVLKIESSDPSRAGVVHEQADFDVRYRRRELAGGSVACEVHRDGTYAHLVRALELARQPFQQLATARDDDEIEAAACQRVREARPMPDDAPVTSAHGP